MSDAAIPAGDAAARRADGRVAGGFSFSVGKRVRSTGGYAGRLGATVERGLAQYVLVVDDDPSIRLLCRINLQLEGWSVREAESLTEARRELAAGGAAVVLLDVHVGLESGVEFLDELRRDHPELPVAMLTGSVERSTIEDLPAQAVIAKPFTLDQLSDTVRVLAAGGRVKSPPS